MDTSLYVNLSYQSSLTRRLELIANNIANVNTTAYKAERVMFDDVTFNAGPAADVSFVIDRASFTDFQTGTVTQTGNQLDVAIVGEGWLSVQTADGVRYTRDGRLQVSAANELINVDGAQVLDEGGNPILIPQEAASIAISKNGGVSVQIQGEPTPTEIANLGIFAFDDPNQLIREADGRFGGNVEAQQVENARVQQFALESSNINPIKEIIELMELSRAYTQVTSASDDIHKQKEDSIERLGATQ
ncbi:MAG: flagellar basal-body rod protein FlgF [Pseudomonadota bacterium]